MANRGDKVLAKVLSYNWFGERDSTVLLSLYQRKVLDMDCIRDLHFDFSTGKAKAYQRVKKMEDAGLIRSFWKYSHKFLTLGDAGAYYVAGQLDTDVKDLKYRLNPDQTIQNLEHYIGTNRTGITLETAARLKGYEMRMFFTEPNVDYGENKRFQPDAVGHLLHERDMPFYLEYDRATQSPKTFGDTKVRNYQNAWASGKHGEHFDLFPSVLVVTEGTDERVAKLRAEVEQRLEARILFMLTTTKRLREDPMGPIWTTPKRDGFFSIIQAGRKQA